MAVIYRISSGPIKVDVIVLHSLPREIREVLNYLCLVCSNWGVIQ